MSEPNDSLYDLSDAIALSRRLTGNTGTAPQAPGALPDSPYLQFSAGARSAPQAARPSASPRAVPSPVADELPLPTEPFGSWEEVLDWCLEFTKARCGFIVDAQGFVMITAGKEVPDDGFEGAGANLGEVFADLGRMELQAGRPAIADLTYEKRAFLAVRVVDAGGEHCTLGILNDDRDHSWPKHAIYQQIMKSLPNLLL